MQRYVSVRANAKYFTECVTKCLIDNKHREPTEKDFWDFVSTIQFEKDVISRNCKFWGTMKAFADRHSIARPANIWKITFENAAPLDDRFRDYLSYMKLEVRRQGKKLSCTERLGVVV